MGHAHIGLLYGLIQNFRQASQPLSYGTPTLGMDVSLANFYVVIGAERVNLKLDDSDKHRPQSKQLFVFVGGCDKTRQDKTRQCFIWSLIQSYVHQLFIQGVCVCPWGDGGAHSVLGLGQI